MHTIIVKKCLLLLFILSVLVTTTGSAYVFPYEDGEGYFEEVSRYESLYASSSEGRKHNVALAAEALDGTYLQSGGRLSFNAVVGKRSAERGYREAPVIENGKYVPGIGGGVCQVSTALFNAALLAGLDIETSVNHSYPSSYAPPGLDAAVSEYADLVILNSSDYPAIVCADADGEKLVITIYSQKTSSIGKIRLTTVMEKVIVGEYEKEFCNPSELGEETEKILVPARDGCVVSTYRIKDGKKKKIRTSYYKPQNGVKLVPRES